MSIEIRWRPTDTNDHRLNVAAPMTFMDVMAQAGFKLPYTLTDDDLPILRAMAAVYGRNGGDMPNPFAELVDLVVLHTSIDLYPIA